MQKRNQIFKSLLLGALLLLGILPGWAQSFSGSGSGTDADPYLIFNPIQLNDVRNFTNKSGVVFKLMSDIDMSEWIADNNPTNGWEPIGTANEPFMGKFIGQGKTISGIVISRTNRSYVGFWGNLSGATINNLTITGSHVYGGAQTGALAGKAVSSTLSNITLSFPQGVTGGYASGGAIGWSETNTINNVNMTGSLTVSSSRGGGFVGFTKNGTIANCSHNGLVSGKGHTGGFAGFSSTPISDCSHSGNVNGTDTVGGFVGESTQSLLRASANGNVTGGSYIGGFAGVVANNTLNYCSSSATTITSTGSYAGGFIGFASSSTIRFSTQKGSLTRPNNYAGGFIGYSKSTTTTNCTQEGNVDARGRYSGGFAGYASTSSITSYKHNGDVMGTDYTAGLVGYALNLTANTVQCQGNVTGNGMMVSGLVGNLNGNASLTSCGTTGDVSGALYVGGIIGYVNNDSHSEPYSNYQANVMPTYTRTIDNCFAVGNYTCSGDYLGGILGNYTYGDLLDISSNSMTILDTYYNGILHGNNYVGGIVGYGDGVKVDKCMASGQVHGNQYVGGITGTLNSTATVSISSSITSCVSACTLINAPAGNTGRIYGTIGTGTTIGVTGSSTGNRALATAIVSNGTTIVVDDDEQNGSSVGNASLRMRSNYSGLGWNFNKWTQLETESYPYKSIQAAPPVLTVTPASGGTTLSGKGSNGCTIVAVIDGVTYQAPVQNNLWNMTVSAMQSGTSVLVYAKNDTTLQSYYVYDVVRFTGSGTSDNPYKIYTATDLANINSNAYYQLMNDIDVTDWINANSPTQGWLALGKRSGTVEPMVLDGNGHTISGLWSNQTTKYNALISQMNNGTVKNLTIKTSSPISGTEYTAVVVGKAQGTQFQNINVEGKADGSSYVGLVAGQTANCSFTNITVKGKVNAQNYVGGVTGHSTSDTFVHGRVTATGVTGKNCVGGFAGYNSACNFSDCKAQANLVGSNYVGGIASGRQGGNTYNDVSYSGTISATGDYVGGITGWQHETLNDVTADGSFTGANYVGGISGYADAAITHSTAAVTLKGSNYVGGITGYAGANISRCHTSGDLLTSDAENCHGGGIAGISHGNISDCYSTANVEAGLYVGGIVGHNYGMIERCYSSGDLKATKYAGGIVGYNDGASAETHDCFASNQRISVSDSSGIALRVIGGIKNNAPVPVSDNYAYKSMVVSINNVTQRKYDDVLEGIGIEMSALMALDTYLNQGWDFNGIWMINDGEGLPYQDEPQVDDLTLMGDVNADQRVSVTDVVVTANYVVGNNTANFNRHAADINGDNLVTVADVVGIANIALDFGKNNVMRKLPVADASTLVNLDATHAGQTIDVTLSNAVQVAALQLQVSLPDGVSVDDIALTDRAQGLMVTSRVDEQNVLHIVAFSLDGSTISIGQGAVLHIVLNGDVSEGFCMSGIRLAQSDMTEYLIDNILISDPVTSLDCLTAKAIVNGADGCIGITVPDATAAQVSTLNGMTRMVRLNAGYNLLSMPAGIYLVNIDGTCHKVIVK